MAGEDKTGRWIPARSGREYSCHRPWRRALHPVSPERTGRQPTRQLLVQSWFFSADVRFALCVE